MSTSDDPRAQNSERRTASPISRSRDRTARCGSAKAARPRSAASIRTAARFTEFALPTENATPIGIALGADGNLWFAEKAANKIGRITPAARSRNSRCRRGCRSRRHDPRPRRQYLVFRERRQPHRQHHAGRPHHRIWRRHFARRQTVVDRGARRRAVVFRSRRQPHRPHHDDGAVTEFPIPSHDSQPRAMVSHPDGSIWFVETSTNALGRIDRARPHHRACGADAERLAARRHRRRRRRPLVHRELRQQDRLHGADGTVRGEYDIPTPNSGARCIAALADGRLFFTQYDAGAIGEVVIGGSERNSSHPFVIRS